MSIYITVIAIKNGYGQSGHKVKTYGGNEERTDSSGKAIIEAAGSSVTIFLNGRTVYDGSSARCPNPLKIEL